MPREVIERKTYRQDVAYLTRLMRAVEIDRKMEEPKKKTIGKQIEDLIVALIRARSSNA